ncbi:Ribosomal RNA small subunit methyltransferase A [Desulfovibrionales bacterium]
MNWNDIPVVCFRAADNRLGQHFLVDRNISRKIVNLAAIGPEDRVLEIGPGSGALTRFIIRTPHAWFGALERDRYWAFITKREYPDVAMVVVDALTFAWENLTPGQTWKILGNLPYNIASPLIWDIVSRMASLSLAVFMVQKEVGERLVAHPGSKDYGAISVWVQSFVTPRLAFCVGPQAFRPRPKINSAVLIFVPLPIDRQPVHQVFLSRLIARCFQQRRKQLHTILKDWWSEALEKQLEAFGHGPHSRPEELSVRAFKSLSQIIDERSST